MKPLELAEIFHLNKLMLTNLKIWQQSVQISTAEWKGIAFSDFCFE